MTTTTALLVTIFVAIYAVRLCASIVAHAARWLRRRKGEKKKEQERRREIAVALLAAWSSADAAVVDPAMIAKAYHDADAILGASEKAPLEILEAADPKMSDAEINEAAARAFAMSGGR